MRTLGIAVAITALAMTGCYGGHCGPTSSASWLQPSLYDAMEGLDNHNVQPAFESPDPGLPFEVDTLPWPGYSLLRLDEGNKSERFADRWRLDRADDGAFRVTGTLSTNGTESSVRESFIAFVDPWSLAPIDERQSWADAFVASKRDGTVVYRDEDESTVTSHAYSTTISGPFDLETYYASLARNATPADDNWDVEAVDRSFGNVTFHFAVPYASVTIEGEGGEYKLYAGVNDFVLVRYPSQFRLTEHDAKSWAERTFEELGLPSPTFTDWDFWTMVC